MLEKLFLSMRPKGQDYIPACRVVARGEREQEEQFERTAQTFLLFPSGIWAEEEKVPGIMDGGFLYVVAAFGK